MKDDSNLNERYVDYAANLILGYNSDEPFHLYLKRYFKANPKHGSRDRKMITSYCYHYFRLGNGAGNQINVHEKIRLADKLISPSGSQSLLSKLEKKSKQFSPDKIFPFNDELSSEIERLPFNMSFLSQPSLFLRIRPGKHKSVLHSLEVHNVPFKVISKNCIALENTTQLSNYLHFDKEVVIQDVSSQRIGSFLKKIPIKHDEPLHLWDACAGSGGKSILATDILRNFKLTVSDIRSPILKNLKKRFHLAGITKYQLLEADLTKPLKKIPGEPFDLIVADVPCSGSGTWARTHENLHSFKESFIEHYSSLQRTIIHNCLPKLKKGGYLLYITCSVFRRENEDNTDFFCKKYHLNIVHQQYLTGYRINADTLFACLMESNPVEDRITGTKTILPHNKLFLQNFIYSYI